MGIIVCFTGLYISRPAVTGWNPENTIIAGGDISSPSNSYQPAHAMKSHILLVKWKRFNRIILIK